MSKHFFLCSCVSYNYHALKVNIQTYLYRVTNVNKKGVWGKIPRFSQGAIFTNIIQNYHSGYLW